MNVWQNNLHWISSGPRDLAYANINAMFEALNKLSPELLGQDLRIMFDYLSGNLGCPEAAAQSSVETAEATATSSMAVSSTADVPAASSSTAETKPLMLERHSFTTPETVGGQIYSRLIGKFGFRGDQRQIQEAQPGDSQGRPRDGSLPDITRVVDPHGAFVASVPAH
jgi:hypothetical protein